MLELVNVSKHFGEKEVLDNISLKFEDGNIYGLQGENGCGKTVILKLLAGYMPASEGKVYQDGIEIRKNHNYIQNAGIVIENVSFLPYLTLIDNLKMLKTMNKKITDEAIKFWIDYYHLNKHINTKYKNLSLGTKQKLALIQSFIHKPRILLLDEPMNALDEDSVVLTKNVIKEYSGKGIVVMTSHISQDISDLCNQRYLVQEGKASLK